MRTGSLFAGYAGLDLAVNAYFGASTAWFSEIDDAPARILAHHYPDVPNHGDITTIDWAQVEPVDILTGGFPCQDVSAAGRRAGIREGTRSGLWSHFAEAINRLRPRYVVIENVRGLLSASAYRPMEPEPDAVGDRRTGPVLRALGAVLGDLCDIGYDAQWTTVSAADVGACHRRERVFIVATPADAERGGWDGWSRHTFGQSEQRVTTARGGEGCGRGGAVTGLARLTAAVDMLKAGRADEYYRLLPTPRATDGAKGGPNQRGSSGDLMLPSAVTLLPTPRTSDGGLDLRTAVVQWGDYEPAIRRAELACGRPAPSPTEPNRNGNPRLSARFAEWMMMLPDGWVTDPAIGLSRNEQLKAIGNGVVPAQAYAALSMLVPIAEAVA